MDIAVSSLLRGCQAQEDAPDESNQTQKDNTFLDRDQSKVNNRCQRPNLVASIDDGEGVLEKIVVIVNAQHRKENHRAVDAQQTTEMGVHTVRKALPI
jgi:hypothetical protein